MANSNAQLLDSFARWLTELGKDVTRLSEVLEAEATRPPPSTRNPDDDGRRLAALELVAGALNYLFKSIDLIQDGIEDVGYLDDCFVLRVCTDSALTGIAVRTADLQRLHTDTELIREFLGTEDYERLQRYSEGTRHLKVRGRTPKEIATLEDVRASFLGEVHAWANAYRAPTFSREMTTTERLRSFLAAKLPS
jgi:uncharacterized membrane protein YkvA (DUF1232 family)